MNLAEFLLAKGTTLEQVVAIVQDQITLRPGDQLYVAGSLVEGLGNDTSDIDLFLVSERDISLKQTGPAIIMHCGRAAIDLECWHPNQVKALLDKVPSNVDVTTADHRPSLAWSVGDIERLHRLASFQLVWGEDRWLSTSFVDPSLLAQLVFSRCLAICDAVHIDLVGASRVNDLDQTLLLSNKLLGHCVDALSAAFGQTNPAEKWRLARLRKVSALTSNEASIRLDKLFLELTAFDADASHDRIRHSRRALNFCNWIIPHSQRYFGSAQLWNAVNSLERLGLAGANEIFQPMLRVRQDAGPELNVGSQIRWIHGELVLGAFAIDTVIIIGTATHRLLMRCNGRQSINQLAAWMTHDHKTNVGEMGLACEDLFRTLQNCGLLEPGLSSP